MKVRKYTEPQIKELCVETPSQAPSKNQSVSKIIESYQELLLSLNSKIQELTIDLELTRDKLGVTETRYATLLGFVNDDGRVDVNQLLDKIDTLERKLIKKDAEISRFKFRLADTSSTASSGNAEEKADDFPLVEKKHLSSYFNFEAIRNNDEILSRKRKNSLQEQSQSLHWYKALQTYTDQNNNLTKFRQKTLPYLKKFIPYEQRCRVWPIIFNNQLGLTHQLYSELQERRSNGLVDLHVVSQIKRDIDRSFSCRMNLKNKQALSNEVQEILESFHLFRPDISYVQGMTYPVIILATVVGKLEAFKIFSNLIISNKFFREMFSFEEHFIGVCWRVFDCLLMDMQPQIAKHLESLNIRSEIFLIEWFFTLFSRGHSLDITMKIWDLLGYHGEIILYRLSLSIFEIIGKRLLPHNYEHTIGLIQSYWSYIDEQRLLELVAGSKLGTQKISRAFQKMGKLLH